MRVLIVGAGIGGLALGAHLYASGHEVTIIEKADALHHAGFVLGLWGAGLKTLQAFSIAPQIERAAYLPTRFTLRNMRGQPLRRFNFEDIAQTYGKAITLLRSDFHQILLDLNNKHTIRLDTSITKIQDKGRQVVASLTDGRQEAFDLVVGADGIHSKVRELVFGKGHAKYSGLTSWIAMADQPVHLRPNITEIWAGDRYVGVFPFKGSKFCTIFGLKAKRGEFDAADSQELLRAKFGSFGWIVPEILDRLQPQDHMFHTDWNEVYLPSWTKGRVVLIGDAAHAMLPTAGSGASLALEDAYWLAMELSANPGDVPVALSRFTKRQQALVAALRRRTDFIGRLIKLSGPAGAARDILIRTLPASWIHKDIAHLMTIQNKDLQRDRYLLTTTWAFNVPLSQLQQTFQDFEQWPSWGKIVKLVSIVPERKGARLRFILGLWFYHLHIALQEKQTARNTLQATVSGDLFGDATVQFVQHAGGSAAVIRWHVLVERPWVRAASRYLHPVFVLLHNLAMRQGAKSLARAMQCRVVAFKTERSDG